MFNEGVIIVIAIGNLIAGYLFISKILRGTGSLAGLGVGAILGLVGWFIPEVGVFTGLIVFLVVGGLELRESTKKRKTAYSQLVFEGGGIRRGLTAVETAFLLKLPNTSTMIIGLSDLARKGLVSFKDDQGSLIFRVMPAIQIGDDILNPNARKQARRTAARQINQTISPVEDILLELVEQNSGSDFSDISFDVWLEFGYKEIEQKLIGFDQAETLDYYTQYIHHRLDGVKKGDFSEDEYITWMVLEFYYGSQGRDFIIPFLEDVHPNWLEDRKTLLDWLSRFQVIKKS